MRKTLISDTLVTTIAAAITASGEYIGPKVDISDVPVSSKVSVAASVFAPLSSTAVEIVASLDFSNNGVHWDRDVVIINASSTTRGRATGTDFTDYNCCFMRARITKITGTDGSACVDAKV